MKVIKFILSGLSLVVAATVLLLLFTRFFDGFFHEPAVNEFAGPDLLMGLYGIFSVITLVLSITSPAFGLALLAVVTAVYKQYVDNVSTPLVSTTPIVAMVTGANSGIGLGVSKELVSQGHRVVMACRSQERCDSAAASVLHETGAPEDRVLAIGGFDLIKLSEIKSFLYNAHSKLASTSSSTGPVKVDLLIGNAGFVPVGNRTTAEGFEQGLGGMHLGHFALVKWMLDTRLLVESSEVVMVASEAMRAGGFHGSLFTGAGEGDLRGEFTTGCGIPLPVCLPTSVEGFINVERQTSDGVTKGAYPRAKLANMLFARELQRRGLVRRATAVHPGMVHTNIISLDGLDQIQNLISKLLLRPPAVAARVLLHAAVDPIDTLPSDDERDPYLFYFGGHGTLLDTKSLHLKSKATIDTLSKRLWDVSELHVEQFAQNHFKQA